MQRWDIINHLIKENNYKDYLEIGYYKGWSFDNVKCDHKIAVDPNPCKDINQENWAYGGGQVLSLEGKVAYYRAYPHYHLIAKMTSNDYFSKLDNDTKYDIIFIDGLHEFSQVERDIQNSLHHLSENGTIVLHDMLPPTLEHVTTGDKYGNWNGDCYKALLKFINEDISFQYTIKVVDTDWGCGIIQKSRKPGYSSWKVFDIEYSKAIQDFNYFQENKDKLFEIITPEEFLTLYNK